MSNPNPAPIDRLLDPSAGCRQISQDVSVHWFPTAALPGQSCHCGAMRKGRDSDDDECGRCALEADHFGPCRWPGDPEDEDDDTP